MIESKRKGPRPKSVTERFWPKVNKDGPVSVHRPALGPCWLWTAYIYPDGYGRLRVAKATTERRWTWALAHRLAYEMLVGPIPEGLTIDHLCRVHACVNPRHMEPVTQGENVLRGIGLTAQESRQTHCHKGHEFTPENTYTPKRGGRHCRVCRRDAQSRSRARQ
jgi:hypothetical protein